MAQKLSIEDVSPEEVWDFREETGMAFVTQNVCHLGAYVDGRLVALLEAESTPGGDTDVLVLTAAFTLPEFQGQGIMRALVEEAVECASPERVEGYNIVSDGGAYLVEMANKILEV